jgi:hypothetical protein
MARKAWLSWYDTITRLCGPRRWQGPIERLNFRGAVVRAGLREAHVQYLHALRVETANGLTRPRHTALYTLHNG